MRTVTQLAHVVSRALAEEFIGNITHHQRLPLFRIQLGCKGEFIVDTLK
jgi:hypothetical protein